MVLLEVTRCSCLVFMFHNLRRISNEFTIFEKSAQFIFIDWDLMRAVWTQILILKCQFYYSLLTWTLTKMMSMIFVTFLILLLKQCNTILIFVFIISIWITIMLLDHSVEKSNLGLIFENFVKLFKTSLHRLDLFIVSSLLLAFESTFICSGHLEKRSLRSDWF